MSCISGSQCSNDVVIIQPEAHASLSKVLLTVPTCEMLVDAAALSSSLSTTLKLVIEVIAKWFPVKFHCDHS